MGTNRDNYQTALDDRASSADTFTTRSFETQEAIDACIEALRLMAQLKNEPATPVLLQTTTATMATLEDKFKNLKGQGGYAPLVMTLATLMTA